MSNPRHWVDKFAARCALIYPEYWALSNKDLMQAKKYEYATTRGLQNATVDEMDRALDIWVTRNNRYPKPSDLVDYLELARAEIRREKDIEIAKKSLIKPNEYVSYKISDEINQKVEKYRKKNPNATWPEVCKALLNGALHVA